MTAAASVRCVHITRLTAAGRSIRPLSAARYAGRRVFVRACTACARDAKGRARPPPPPPQGLRVRPATWRLPRAARPATGAALRRRHRLPPPPDHNADNHRAINSVAAAAAAAKRNYYIIVLLYTKCGGDGEKFAGCAMWVTVYYYCYYTHARRALVGGGWLVRMFVPRPLRIDVDAARLGVLSRPSECAHDYDYYYA